MTDQLIALGFYALVFAAIGLYFARQQRRDIMASRERTARAIREADEILARMKAESPRVEPVFLPDGREVTPELLDELFRQTYGHASDAPSSPRELVP